jgi:integrase
MARTRKLPPGCRYKRGGIQARVDIVGRPQITKTFPLDEPYSKIIAWREEQFDTHGGGAKGTFEADVTAYLAKPDAVQGYRRMLRLWLEALGKERRRSSITKDEIEGVIRGWLKSLSPVTVYHRRTALQSLYVSLDGSEAYNPVKHTTRPTPHQPKHKALDHATLARIVEQMTDARYISKGITQPSLSKLAATVMLHTGLPYAEICKLTPRHLAELDAGRYIFPAREKGAGTDEAIRSLLPAGVAALRAFHLAKPYDRLPTVEAMGRSFKRAARAILGEDTAVTTYWLRHSFGTDLYRLTGDTETVARLMGHADGSPMTARYTKGAHADVDAKALAQLATARAVPAPTDNRPAIRPAPRIRLRKKHLAQVG